MTMIMSDHIDMSCLQNVRYGVATISRLPTRLRLVDPIAHLPT